MQIALTDDSGNAIVAKGTTANIPSAVSGYATGCKFIATDSGVEYINYGSSSSCTFISSYRLLQTTTSLGTVQSSTPTAAQLLGGIVTQTSATGAGTVTLPTGTQLSAAISGVSTGYTFQVLFANLGGGQTLTITGATGSTVIGTAAVASTKNATLTFTNTGSNAWSVYCVVSA